MKSFAGGFSATFNIKSPDGEEPTFYTHVWFPRGVTRMRKGNAYTVILTFKTFKTQKLNRITRKLEMSKVTLECTLTSRVEGWWKKERAIEWDSVPWIKRLKRIIINQSGGGEECSKSDLGIFGKEGKYW